MPISIKYKCPLCKGETDQRDTPCIPCSLHEVVRLFGNKHLPSDQLTNDKDHKSN